MHMPSPASTMRRLWGHFLALTRSLDLIRLDFRPVSVFGFFFFKCLIGLNVS